MAKLKYDGVVEAVHYQPDGQIGWVRVYERRGPTFSDHVILKREVLISRLKAGKKFMVGSRIPQLGGTFEVTTPVSLVSSGSKEVLRSGDGQADKDLLDGVPLI